MASEMEQQLARLQADVERLEACERRAIAGYNSLVADREREIRQALQPHLDRERNQADVEAWLLAQVAKDPRPLRHDADCWLRHLHCFAVHVLRVGGIAYAAGGLRERRAVETRDEGGA